MYNASQNAAFDKHDIAVYEEVACIPPFSRKMLVLLIQSRTVADGITQTIVESNPDIYGKSEKTIEPPTTNGSSSSTTLHSEQSESFYNPQLTAAREILKEGKTCVMTATPQCLKLLRTSEFMPFVVFLKSNEDLESPPEENIFNHSNEDIERHYSRYIDTTLDMAPTNQLSEEIIEKLGQLKTKHQWVPTSWVY
uniref:MAGUK p55 subfamily member 2-like n=1 Tax=Styela clava TaxID=7725 RepID=UPI00193A82E8|nr:MAGUK p55 subfamily member 2-like [Styela clava]